MGNNKTIVPGMGGNNNFDYNRPASQTTQFFGAPQAQPTPQPQPAPQPQQPAYSGTHFPGMEGMQNRPAANPNPNNPIAGSAHKTIMGFLYSVSRTSEGEYWPLYLGLNTIGRATNSSVRLSEATISDNHAEIVVRQMKNPDSVLVSIQDARSTCGTLLNGSSLGFDAQECHSGDIITVGEHYELYLIIVDAKTLGLAKRDDFVSAGVNPAMGGGMPGGMPGMGGMPYGGAPQYPSGNMGQPQQKPGGSSTVIMPGVKR